MHHRGGLVGLLVASLLAASLVVPTGHALVIASYGPIYEGPMEGSVPSPQGCIPVSFSVIPPDYDINENCLPNSSDGETASEDQASPPESGGEAAESEPAAPQEEVS